MHVLLPCLGQVGLFIYLKMETTRFRNFETYQPNYWMSLCRQIFCMATVVETSNHCCWHSLCCKARIRLFCISLQFCNRVQRRKIKVASYRLVNENKYDSNKSTHKLQQFYKFILDVYVWLNMFRTHPRPSSGAYNCTRSLWCYRWSVFGRGLAGFRFRITCQTTTNNAPTATLQR
jgi:hypothetical protein